MKRLLIALVLSVFGAVLLADESGKESGLLKARIAQLEAQVLQIEASRAVCEVRLNQTQASQAVKVLEMEAGCSIDWASVPPKCKE